VLGGSDLGLATGVNNYLKNRIFAFIKGEIAISYACKLTGWHMSKIIGFDMQLERTARRSALVASPGRRLHRSFVSLRM
jgi:hypothetical protein